MINEPIHANEPLLKFTADRLISRHASPEMRRLTEQAVRGEVIRAAKEHGYYLPDGVDIYEVTELVPSDPNKPLPPDLIGIRARAIGLLRSPK